MLVSGDFLERLGRLNRMASAAQLGPLDHRAPLDLRACLVRPGPLAGRATPAPPVRLAPQARPASAVPPAPLVLSARPAPRVAKAQQEQRAQLVRRE